MKIPFSRFHPGLESLKSFAGSEHLETSPASEA
jgi:hypothetical protein